MEEMEESVRSCPLPERTPSFRISPWSTGSSKKPPNVCSWWYLTLSTSARLFDAQTNQMRHCLQIRTQCCPAWLNFNSFIWLTGEKRKSSKANAIYSAVGIAQVRFTKLPRKLKPNLLVAALVVNVPLVLWNITDLCHLLIHIKRNGIPVVHYEWVSVIDQTYRFRLSLGSDRSMPSRHLLLQRGIKRPQMHYKHAMVNW